MAIVKTVLMWLIVVLCIIFCVAAAVRDNEGRRGISFGDGGIANKQASGRLKKFQKNYRIDKVCAIGLGAILAATFAVDLISKYI